MHITDVKRTAKPSRVNSFMKLIHPFGILESSRTGMTALPRSPLHEDDSGIQKDLETVADVVDTSMLPPG